MTLRQYLLALTLGTALAIAAAAIVLFAIDPVTAGIVPYGILYITLGCALIGLCTLVGTLWRVWRNTSEDVGDAVARSLRQGVFLALLVIVALWLSAHAALNTWTVLLLVACVTLVESFFLLGKKA